MQGRDQLVYLFMVYIQVRVPPFYSVVAVVSVLVVFTWNVIVYNRATAALLSTVVRHMLTIQETAGSWVERILFNAGHEPELQSYTAAVDTWIQSLLPLSLYSELSLVLGQRQQLGVVWGHITWATSLVPLEVEEYIMLFIYNAWIEESKVKEMF